MPNILITGANRGIGLEFVKQYLAAGATVIATARQPAKAGELEKLGQASKDRLKIMALDASDGASVAAAARDLKATAIDLLIHNAGVGGQRDAAPGRMDYAALEETLKVNTVGPYRVVEAFLPAIRQGKDKKIVIVSSMMGSLAMSGGGMVSYRVSKAGANMVARTLAKELAGEGLIVVPVHPGWVRTDMGGPNATLSAEESVAGLRQMIAGLTPEKSGRFWQWNGEELPW